jgi:hypothetical protein
MALRVSIPAYFVPCFVSHISDERTPLYFVCSPNRWSLFGFPPHLLAPFDRIYAIGDNPKADIRGAKAAGASQIHAFHRCSACRNRAPDLPSSFSSKVTRGSLFWCRRVSLKAQVLMIRDQRSWFSDSIQYYIFVFVYIPSVYAYLYFPTELENDCEDPAHLVVDGVGEVWISLLSSFLYEPQNINSKQAMWMCNSWRNPSLRTSLTTYCPVLCPYRPWISSSKTFVENPSFHQNKYEYQTHTAERLQEESIMEGQGKTENCFQ